MSTYSVPISGPSARIAMLAALVRKTATHSLTAWAHAQTVIAGVARHTRILAHTALAVVGSDAGYQMTITGIRTLITTAWRAAKAATSWVAGTAGAETDRVISLVGALSGSTADRLARIKQAVTAPLAKAARSTTMWIETAGHLAWMLAVTDLVRTCTTRAAMAAVTLISVHAITQGALAAKLVAALPWTMDAVVAITDPIRALAFVAGTALVAMAVAVARLVRQTRQPEPPPVDDPASSAVPTSEDTAAEVEVLTDLAVIAGKVTVEVQRDGSILVTGIPDSVPPDLGQAVAEIATDAALRQLRRTLRVRPTPSRDDRRLFTKAARDAIRAEAARRRGQAA